MQSKKKTLSYFFLRKKPVMILVNLKKDDDMRYASTLAREVNCTYSHTIKILDLLAKKGLVKFKKKGRTKFVTLTPKGRELANYFEKILHLFSKIESS